MKTISRQTILTFSKRPRRSVSDTAVTWTWEARSGDWRIQRRHSLFGLPEVWLVLRLDPEFRIFDIVDRRRTRRAAFRAAEQHAAVKDPGGR